MASIAPEQTQVTEIKVNEGDAVRAVPAEDNPAGETVNQAGETVNQAGETVHQTGETVNQAGETVNPAGEAVEDPLEEDGEPKPEKKLIRSRSTRGKAFSALEGLKLAKSWVAERTENLQQKDADMWRGIEDRCRLDGMNRSAASLKKVWSFLQRNTLKYLASKFSVEGRRVGHETAEDIERRIMELYRKNLGDVKHGNFKFVMAANWLQHQPKFFEAYGAIAEVNHVQVPVALELVPKHETEDVVMQGREYMPMEPPPGVALTLEAVDGVVKRPAADALPPPAAAATANGARAPAEKRQRTDDGRARSEGDGGGAGAEELAGIRKAVQDGLAAANSTLQQFLDIQLLAIMKDGPDKTEMYNAIVEERKFRVKERTQQLRKELQGGTHLPGVE